MTETSAEVPNVETNAPVVRSLLHKVTWCSAGSLIVTLCRFPVTVLLARLLSAQEMGLFAYLMWLSETTGLVAGFGVQTALTRFAADLTGKDQAFRARDLARWVAIRYPLIIVAGLATVSAITRGGSAGSHISSAAWLLVVANFGVQGFGSIYTAYLTGCQRFAAAAKLNVASALVSLVAATLATYHLGALGALGGYVVGGAIPAAAGLKLLGGRRGDTGVDRELRRRVVRFAAQSWGAAVLSSFVWSRNEVFFLERYRGTQETAFFTVGLSFAALAAQGPLLLSAAFMPHLAERYGAGDLNGARRAYLVGTRLLVLLMFPACFGMAALAPRLFPMLYGRAYVDAVPTAMVLVVCASLSFTTLAASLVYAAERAWFITANAAVLAVLAVIAAVFVIPRWGALGAAWARALLQLTTVPVGGWFLWRELRCPVPYPAITKTTFAAAAAALPAYLVVIGGGRWSLATAGLLFAAVYLILTRLLRIVDADDAQLLLGVCDRLPQKLRGQARAVVCLLTGPREA